MKKQPAKLLLFSLILAALITFVVYQKINSINALSKGFIQTDWSGRDDTNATADDTYLLDWNKYYSATNVDSTTSGEIKLDRILITPTP